MPDLENKIQGWKKQLAAGGIKTSVLLDELESHLREEIESQIRSGLTEADAFAGAVKKIGSARLLKAQFDQARRERERERMQLIAFAALVIVALFAGATALFRLGSCAQLSPIQQGSSLLAVLLMLVFALAGRWGGGMFPVIHSNQTRKMVGISTIMVVAFWEAIFFFVILPRSEFDMGQLLSVFYWAFLVPFGFALSLVTGLENAARKSLTAKA